ncbi:PREDICTED: glucan endo-1,3-beta-glucosidase 11-like [Nicotiana attenuata]|uniref:glucan endo-1,3-beta-D-glucosidase n=1 Tax=Nicotiana attenuata TaxID=49451 RepID=A0A1J6IPD0_NICAT|nr:PREDICTED: glucan endo-1,3-beta-glucosidase 11-like [Nicotiana attenuata]OIT06108.1 glucan endo-1,3-beta-glucosidase 11 [Nicotiana attenuata]
MDGLLRRTSFLQILVTFFLLLLGLNIIKEVDSLGINYGQVANNLPTPEKVLQLLHALKITKARIYDTNPLVLTAFANSNIELIVTVENQMLATLGDQQQALQWVTTHIRPYFPATNITGIAVGNEIFTDEDTSLMTYLVPAMVNIHSALIKTGLSQYIQVSSPNSLAVLANSYPPSAGSFRTDLNGIMQQFLQFLVTTRAPFWINAYPYFAYKDNPNKISLDYVLFNSNQGMIDPYTRLHYDNMLYAQVDAAIFAIARMGFNGLEVKISETGWPSKGDPNEIGATFQNAAIYNRNILRRQLLNEGTPLRPNVRLDIYVFALFNEDQKPGPTSERNYGLFQPDGTMAYNVGLLSTTSTTTSSTNSEPASASSFLASSAPPMVKQVRYQSLANWMILGYFCWLCKR